MKPDLVKIPPEDVAQVWPLVIDLVDQGVANTGGRYTSEALRDLAEAGDWQLFVVWNGGEVLAVVMTEIYSEISGLKVASIPFVAGHDRKQWLHLLPSLEGWAEQAGATYIKTWARRGWARHLPDYKLTHVMLEKRLDNGRIETTRANDDADGHARTRV